MSKRGKEEKKISKNLDMVLKDLDAELKKIEEEEPCLTEEQKKRMKQHIDRCIDEYERRNQ